MPTQSFLVAVRDAMVPVIEGQSFFQSFQDLGASAFELLVERDGSFPQLVLEDGSTPFSLRNVEALKERCQEEGVSVCALLLGTDFSGPLAQEDIAWSVASIQAAQVLGSVAVRLDPATANKEISVGTMRENLVRSLISVLQQTAGTSVSIGLENHGFIANDTDFLDAVFDAVNDDRLGLTLDIGNFYWFGMPLSRLYQTIEHFAPRVRHTHIKSICYPVELREQQRSIGYEYGRYATSIDQGDINIDRVLRILQNANYQGALCIENETLTRLSPEESAQILRAEIATLVSALHPV
jgi:sugar phosphate isomerase/epimerase